MTLAEIDAAAVRSAGGEALLRDLGAIRREPALDEAFLDHVVFPEGLVDLDLAHGALAR